MNDPADREGADEAPLLVAAAKGLCPRCGAATLFATMVGFAPRCRACGLDYEQFNVGDGPAAFLTMIVGALVLLLALVVEFSIRPPLWLHVIIWPVLTVICVTGALRLAKGALLILEYRNKAREGVLTDRKQGSGPTGDREG
ncbi:membrane protein [Sphingobium jiangsuense]|uniref:Uncharacterized protein (DUF983 family) n=1 Tax=Sphingobium jiangsuense TaxID=870476 RepID=A0A7W6FPU2_9SPHN|nr:DUF983 domain-containing protein [Sphingobium jiangsuense]MBB3926233.1 uncharacterized protein (DUF983 family) [Sphingobium jiangsuense]GLS99948.1 membrane protein [Sphingobium jiangsuense]